LLVGIKVLAVAYPFLGEKGMTVVELGLEKIVVRGFLVDFRVCSEDVLNVSLDLSGLDWGQYGKYIDELAGLLSEIDKEYAVRDVRGRGLKARYSRVRVAGRTMRKRVLRFSPYPSRFSNALKAIRAKWYAVLNRHTVVLGRGVEAAGGVEFRRYIYFLPEDRVKEFLREVEELNRMVREVSEWVASYNESVHMQRVEELVSKIVGHPMRLRRAEVPEIEVKLYPIRLDPKVVDEYVDESVRKEIEKTRRRLLEEATMDFQKRLSGLLMTISSYVEAMAKGGRGRVKAAERLMATLDETVELYSTFGCQAILKDVVEASRQLLAGIIKKEMKTVVGAVDRLADAAGVKRQEDPAKTVKEVALRLDTELSPRLKALLSVLP